MASTNVNEPVADWLSHLERARQQLHQAVWLLGQNEEPSVDLAPLGGVLQTALGALYDALDQRSDRLDGARRAAAAIDRTNSALSADAPDLAYAVSLLSGARAALEAAEHALASRPLAPMLPESTALQASHDTPRLHHVTRASLVPRVSLSSPAAVDVDITTTPVKPATFAELESHVAALKQRAEERRELARKKKLPKPTTAPPPAIVPAGFSADIPDAISERAFIGARTREMLEEVAMVGLQRAPLPGDPWRTALALEQRMCRAIDAIASMGPGALSYVEPWAMDVLAKDAARMFAVAMTMGCIDGHDALGVVERVFVEFESVEATARDGLVAALALVPHQALPLWLRGWLAERDARRRSVAIEALAFRGLATEMELASAAIDEPMVASRALPALALLAPRSIGDAVRQALQSGDAELESAAWRAMVLADHPGTTDALRAALSTERADEAALWLALCGSDHDAALILKRLHEEPSPSLVRAVGWAGAPLALPPLIELLTHDDEDIVVAAAAALDRITGARLRETAEIDIDDIFVPEPPDPDVGEPQPKRLVRITSDPRDLPPEPSKESIDRASTDATRWRAWYAEHGSSWSSGARYRMGAPYTPLISLAELDGPDRSLPERRLLQHELVIRTGSHVRFDPHDFVSVQAQALEQWLGHAQRASSQPGSFNRPGRR